ncbi:MAG: hypothetical protein R6U17_04295, partial [Thermoplasmata archaeon]
MKNIDKLVGKKKFHVFVLAASLFLFFLTLARTSPGAPEPSVFWYMNSLYWTFWPGLILAFFGIMLSVKGDRRYLALVSVLIPVLYLYTLPNMVHDMVPVFDVYHVIPQVLSIMETGVWDMARIPFPGSHIFQASQLLVLDVDILEYARWFPTLLASTIVLFIYTISKRISMKWAPVAPLMFLSLNWYMEYHLARQPFGMMIWTAFWLAMFLYVDKKDYRLGVLAVLVLFVIVPSHPGMTVIVAMNLIALASVSLISFKKKVRWDYLFPVLPIGLAFVFAFFLFFHYIPGINEMITSRYEGLLKGIFVFSLGGPETTSSQYAFTNLLRMGAGFFQSLLGLIAFYIFYKYDAKKALLVGAWFFSCYGWFLHTFTHPQGRNIERGFLAAIVPASVLIVALLKYYAPKNIDLKELVRVSTVVVLVTFLLMVPLTKNSADTIETPSLSSSAAGRFAQESFDGRVYITDMHQGMFRYIEATGNYTVQFRASGRSPGDQPYGYPIPRTDNPRLSPILFTDYFNNYISVRYGNNTAVQEIE